MIVSIPVSVGELFDKITILEIKRNRITDAAKLDNVQIELEHLTEAVNALSIPDVTELVAELKSVNMFLWDIEDYKRLCERQQKFDSTFVEAARQVYLKNDKRAAIKKEINAVCGSTIVEEKSYE
jgi:hypothetical protein